MKRQKDTPTELAFAGIPMPSRGRRGHKGPTVTLSREEAQAGGMAQTLEKAPNSEKGES